MRYQSRKDKILRSFQFILLSQFEKAAYCMLPTLWTRLNYGDSRKIRGYQGLGRENEGEAPQGFGAMKLLCGIL